MTEVVSKISKSTLASLAKLKPLPGKDTFVVAQLGQSLDGRIATPSGESKYINGEEALTHLHALRAHVDAVVVGVGTAIVDDPQLNVRRFAGKDPARVIIDPSGRLNPAVRCMAPCETPRIVIRATDAVEGQKLPEGVEEIRLSRHGRFVPPAEIVQALAERGLKRLLIEGGAATVSAFIDAGVVDRLHVLVAPMLLGSGKPGLVLDPITRLQDALQPKVDVYVLDSSDVLFDCQLKPEA